MASCGELAGFRRLVRLWLGVLYVPGEEVVECSAEMTTGSNRASLKEIVDRFVLGAQPGRSPLALGPAPVMSPCRQTSHCDLISRGNSKFARLRTEKIGDANLLCDGTINGEPCNRMFHTDCLPERQQPGAREALAAVQATGPRGSTATPWLCPRCQAVAQGGDPGNPPAPSELYSNEAHRNLYEAFQQHLPDSHKFCDYLASPGFIGQSNALYDKAGNTGEWHNGPAREAFRTCQESVLLALSRVNWGSEKHNRLKRLFEHLSAMLKPHTGGDRGMHPSEALRGLGCVSPPFGVVACLSGLASRTNWTRLVPLRGHGAANLSGLAWLYCTWTVRGYSIHPLSPRSRASRARARSDVSPHSTRHRPPSPLPRGSWAAAASPPAARARAAQAAGPPPAGRRC